MSSLILMMMLWSVFVLERTGAVFITVPENKIVFLNSKTELKCSTNSDEPISWFFESTSSRADYQISRKPAIVLDGNLTKVPSKYQIDRRIHGQYNLVIASVDLSYAGRYECSEGSYGPKVEAELAVIDRQPFCEANVSNTEHSAAEGDFLLLKCILSFSGRVNLSMNWFRNSNGSIIQNASNGRNQSMIIIQVNRSDYGETFTFKATFTQENNSLPTILTWNYTEKVWNTPRNIVVIPLKSVYNVGDRLNCSAEGNPTPGYKWTDTQTNRTIEGSVLTIDGSMKSDRNHTFMCTAYNTVTGIVKPISKTVRFSVVGEELDPASTQMSSSSTMIVLMTFVIFIICLIMAILVSCRVNVKAWMIKRRMLMSDPEPDVIRSDPMNHDNDYYEIENLSNGRAIGMTATSRDDSVIQAEPAASIYESIAGEDNAETMTAGVSSSQQINIPVYSRVNKNDTRRERRNRESQTSPVENPVYSEIPATNHASSTNQPINPTARTANQTNYFGVDGTEYTEMNAFRTDLPNETTPKSAIFHPVDNYALIDHTLRAPPPPPKL